jgi:ferredoxin
VIVYRRTRERMPANGSEVEEALEEGVLMKWLSTVKHADAGERPEPSKHPVAEFDKLNPWYCADAPHAVRPRLEAPRRASTFDEVVQGLDASTALYEARRCMSCGICASECPCGAIVMVPEEG